MSPAFGQPGAMHIVFLQTVRRRLRSDRRGLPRQLNLFLAIASLRNNSRECEHGFLEMRPDEKLEKRRGNDITGGGTKAVQAKKINSEKLIPQVNVNKYVLRVSNFL